MSSQPWWSSSTLLVKPASLKNHLQKGTPQTFIRLYFPQRSASNLIEQLDFNSFGTHYVVNIHHLWSVFPVKLFP